MNGSLSSLTLFINWKDDMFFINYSSIFVRVHITNDHFQVSYHLIVTRVQLIWNDVHAWITRAHTPNT